MLKENMIVSVVAERRVNEFVPSSYQKIELVLT